MEAEPGRYWSDAELVEEFSRGIVFARDEQANLTPLPRPLDGQAPWTSSDTWANQLGSVHVDDRGAVVKLWWHTLRRPGELLTTEVRGEAPEVGWRSIQVSFLNLLHQPEVRSVMVRIEDLGPAPDVEVAPQPGPEGLQEGRYVAPTWVLAELGPTGVIERVEGLAEEIVGLAPDEVVGSNIADIVHPDDQPAGMAMWVDVMAEPGATRTIHQRFVRPDGSWTWVESTVINRFNADGEGSVLAISHDISERRAQEALLRASQQEFRSLAEEVPVAVFRADHRGRITFGNARWYELVARSGPTEHITDLASGFEQSALVERWQSFSAGDGTDTLDIEFTSADDLRVLRLHCRRVGTADGKPSFVGVLEDITDTAELRRRADHDALTGLLNRHAFDRELVSTLDAASDEVALCFIDLDGFKQANDLLGHAAGDLILAEVGSRLRSCMRPQDAVARYGGDEFVILCPDLPSGGEHSVVARIEEALAAPVVWDGGEWPLRASIGVVRAGSGEDAVEVVRRADAAMYEMKRARRDSEP